MTLKEMRELARKSFEKKQKGKSIEQIETVGNKGVTHERPTGPVHNNNEEDYNDEN